jgi:hypothetical protein
MGFVALAYRAGSEKKRRVHIFWQKRIRENDHETPWWFPSETRGGAIGEARLVLPIPPGKHWSDEMPVILPKSDATPKLDGPKPPRAKKEKPAAPKRATNLISEGGMRFAPVAPPPPATPAEKPKREKKPKQTCPERSRRKNDPKLVAAARELRDRWLEHVNSGQTLIEGAGKYDVTRALPAASSVESGAGEGTRVLAPPVGATPENPLLLLPRPAAA